MNHTGSLQEAEVISTEFTIRLSLDMIKLFQILYAINQYWKRQKICKNLCNVFGSSDSCREELVDISSMLSCVTGRGHSHSPRVASREGRLVHNCPGCCCLRRWDGILLTESREGMPPAGETLVWSHISVDGEVKCKKSHHPSRKSTEDTV